MQTDTNTNSMLDVGDKIPNLQIDTKNKKVVLYFYPKDDTPGCTKEACTFRDLKADFAKAGAIIIGVSKDAEKSHSKFKEKYGLNFDLLSDEDGKLCEAFGVWQEKSFMGKKYMGIVRSTYLADADGVIRKVWRNVKVDGHMEEVLKETKNL